jgi:catechol 2,3-dioxygenase-like lactoylglutathione lyase family enzyme
MKFDHVALSVTHIHDSVTWYQDNLDAFVEYKDETWAMLNVNGLKIALTSGAHPPHLAFRLENISDFPPGAEAKQHRDGSWYYYDKDLDDNTIEWITYPGL